MCLDRKRAWVLCGTSTGVLSLWDIRFGILIKSWKVGGSLKGNSGRVNQCVVHPTKGKGKWVVVAIETPKTATDGSSHTLLEVWDIEQTVMVETFSTRTVVSAAETVEEPKEVSVEDAEMTPASAIAALVRARQEGGTHDVVPRRMDAARNDASLPPFPDVRAVVVGGEFGGHTGVHRSHMGEAEGKSSSRSSSGRGFVITGSDDCKLRFWDLGRPERSVILSGVETDSEKPTYRSDVFLPHRDRL